MNVFEDRYSRLELIHWWKQDVLKNAKVLVIGAGALGNEIVKNLAMIGTGKIAVVDMDRIEESNLTRSVLFRKEDEGKFKAETAAKRAKEINSDCNFKYYNGDVHNFGIGVFEKFDVVICGLDSREARYFVNRSCRMAKTTWIDGAIEVLSGVARVFEPQGVCYECTMNELDYRLMNTRKSCMMLGVEEIKSGRIPTTPTIASVIGGIEVQEAVKILHKKKEEREDLKVLAGKGFVFNGAVNDSYIVEYQVKEDCPSHIELVKVTDMDKNFADATVEDIIEEGKKIHGDNFVTEFNNEVVYELQGGESPQEFYANLNTLSISDVKRGDDVLRPLSFHILENKSELSGRLKNKKLTELKIPYNDIITIRGEKGETGIRFGYAEIFTEV